MLAACLLFSLMNAGVYATSMLDEQIDSCIISFIRILGNLIILLTPALMHRRVLLLFGDCRPSLWLRGLSGALALMLSFAAIARIGPGESAFLTASSGVFIAMLGPWLLGQKNTVVVWLAIVGSLIGVLLLFKPSLDSPDLIGKSLGLGSGVLTALAYLMVARAGRSNSTNTVIFYFCLMALLVHGIYFSYAGLVWPKNPMVWALLALVCIVGSAAQFFMTRAYQTAPAALVSAIAYLTPVLSMSWGVLWFSQRPDGLAFFGSSLILIFGVILPFAKPAKNPR